MAQPDTPDTPDTPDISNRQDQADARANQMDTRSNQMDVRSGKADRRQDSADEHTARIEKVIKEQDKILESVLQALLDTAASMEGLETRIGKSSEDLQKERSRDKGYMRIVAIVAALSLLGSFMGSLAAYSVCSAANETRSTIRIIIAASYGGQRDSLAPTQQAELAERRKNFQKVVDDRTEPLNCANPLTYFSRK